jgi:phosphotransferase system  glucose/maltose/N-acetylglucosamine-specific IIC component
LKELDLLKIGTIVLFALFGILIGLVSIYRDLNVAALTIIVFTAASCFLLCYLVIKMDRTQTDKGDTEKAEVEKPADETQNSTIKSAEGLTSHG